jgi:glutamyl-tRNA synthetase
MFNYLALLGWRFSGETEIFDRQTAIARFDIDDLQTSHARWDAAKLDWMNGVYIRMLSPEDLADRLLPFLHREGLPAEPEQVVRMVPLIQERLVTLADAADRLSFFWAGAVDPSPGQMIPKGFGADEGVRLLERGISSLDGLEGEAWLESEIESALRGAAEQAGVKLGPFLQGLRLAVTGRSVAPPLFGTLEILGKDKSLDRARAGLATLRAYAASAVDSIAP